MATQKNIRIPEELVISSVAQVHEIDFEEARVLVQRLRSQYPRASKRFSRTPRPLSQAELVWLDARLQAMAAEE